MSTRPYKFAIVPVLQEVDDETGEVLREAQPEQPIIVFGMAGLRAFVETFEEQAAMATLSGMNGGR